MHRCKECGIPIENGEFCSEKCEETWNRREHPPEVDNSIEKKNDEEVLLETHLSITPVHKEEPEKEINDIDSLFKAVANSNSNAVKNFIDEGENVELRNEYGYTALHEAARVGDVKSTVFLLDAGADINAVNNKGWTSLHRASNYGNLDIVKLLIERNAKINVQESEGLIPLAIAMEREHYEIAKYLAVKGADPNCIDKKGRPALIAALKKDQMKLARLLIENGADPNAKEGNESALLLVLKKGDLELVKLLIDKGANPNVKDAEGRTALIYAFKYGYPSIAKLFIENGAVVNCKDSKGQTPLHFASKINNYEIVKLLLDKGAKSVVWNKMGLMPVHISNEKKILKLLNRKMFPSKIIYSLRVFLLAFLLTSVTIPTIVSYVFSVLIFLMALILTGWPRKTSLRSYLLEILAIYLLITTACGVHIDSFSYPYVFLLLPIAVFLLLNFFVRPVFLFFAAIKDDGSRPGFVEFVRDFFGRRLSFSPITVLRTLNTVVIVIIFILSVVYNYDHLKMNDQYLLSHVFRAIPRIRLFKSVGTNEGVKEVKIISANKGKAKFKPLKPGENKYYDRAIALYLRKDFKGAINNLDIVAQDLTFKPRANELRLEIKRFSRLWDRVNHPEEYKKRRGSPINRMIQYDKNISGGKLEAEILMLKHTAE